MDAHRYAPDFFVASGAYATAQALWLKYFDPLANK